MKETNKVVLNNKFSVAMWIIKVIKSCEFVDQVHNCTPLLDRHIRTFRDPLLYELLGSEWARKMRSSMPRWGSNLERQYKLKLDFKK
jgi:hypothetical protein